MAVRRYVNTELWEDGYVQSLNPMQRYLWIYLITNPKCSIAGVYEVTMKTMVDLTGLPKRRITEYIAKFEAEKKLVYRDNWVVLANAPKHQEWESSSPVAKGIENVLRKAPRWVLAGIHDGSIPYAYPIGRVPIPYPEGIGTTGEGLRSYSESDSMKEKSESDGGPVQNLLTGIADRLTPGAPKGRKT